MITLDNDDQDQITTTPTTIILKANTSFITFNITAIHDMIAEVTQTYTLGLSGINGQGELGNTTQTQITIPANDLYTLHFNNTTVKLTEGEPTTAIITRICPTWG